MRNANCDRTRLVVFFSLFIALFVFSQRTVASSELVNELRKYFGITLDEATNSQLEEFLKDTNNRAFVEAMVKQIKHGEAIELFLNQRARFQPNIANETLQYLGKKSIIELLKLIGTKENIFWLSAGSELLGVLSTIGAGINIFLKLSQKLAEFDTREILKIYIHDREHNLDPRAAFQYLYADFSPIIDKIICLRLICFEPTDEEKRNFATYLEFSYQSWKLYNDKARQNDVKGYVLNNLPKRAVQPVTGKPTKLLLREQVKALAFSADSNYLACATKEEVFVYRTYDWMLIQNLKIGKEIRSLAFSPDKRFLAIARGPNVIVYASNSWTVVALLNSSADVYCVQFSPKGDLLLFGTYWTDANIHVYETSSWKEIAVFGASMTKNSISFDRLQRYVAFTSNYKYYPKIYSAQSWNHMATLKGGYGEYDHNTFWYGIKFSPNGRLVAYGFVDIPAKKRTIFIHQAIGQWPLVFSLSWGGDSSLWGVRISPDGHTVSGLGSLDFSPDGQLLAHGAEDVRLFRVDPLLGTLTLVNILKVSQPMGENSLQFSPNGQYLAYVDGKNACIWRVADIPQKLCFDDICLDAPSWMIIAVGVATAVLILIQNLFGISFYYK